MASTKLANIVQLGFAEVGGGTRCVLGCMEAQVDHSWTGVPWKRKVKQPVEWDKYCLEGMPACLDCRQQMLFIHQTLHGT